MQAATPNIYLFFLVQRLLRLQDLHFGQLIAHLLSRRLLRGEGNADLAIVEKKNIPLCGYDDNDTALYLSRSLSFFHVA